MSYFDDASLVMIPSGYKDQKVYSVKPIDGSGDLTFSRASNATRVNSSGLVEKVRTNLVLQSNTFSNASWSNGGSGVVLTSGQEDPNGGTNGWRFLVASASGYLSQNSVLLTNTSMTVSVWVKSNTGVAQSFRMTANSGSQTSPFLIAGTSWTRVSWSFVSSSNGNILFPFSSSALDLLVYGFQVETGDIATDYIATTTAAVSVGPVSGLPRLDYSGGASCPSLLLEPTATALNQFSEQLDNAYWTKANCTVTANQVVSPSGYADADLVLDDTSNNQHVITRSIAVTSGNKYTSSFFLKPAGHTTAAIRMGNGSLWTGGTGPTVEFDLVALTGTVVDGSGVTFSIEDYGNGWVRCAVTGTCVTSGNTVYSLYVKQYNAYIGNGTSGIYAWGGNITATGYVQSYIPTLSTAVTRVADAALKTGISSLIGQTEGTLFAELKISSNDSTFKFLSLSDGTTSNSVWIYYRDTDNQINFRVIVGGVSQFDQIYTSPDSTTTHKLAIKYKQNDFSAWFNGTKVLTDTSGNTFSGSTLSEFDFFRPDGVNYFYGDIKQVLLFKTALTDAELAELTTL